MTKIKVCGIANAKDALHISRLGIDYLGFIINVQNSPRSLTIKELKLITDKIKRVKTVGVFVDEEIDFVKKTIKKCGLDVVQLHGNESVEYCEGLKSVVEVWKAVIIKNKDDLEKVTKYRKVVDKILFDSGKGSGKQIDFGLLQGRKIDILAGGLGINNITESIKKLRPEIIDLNSCVEVEPGKKDINLIKEIISMNKIFTTTKYDADEDGYFGKYGGQYVPELLSVPLKELEQAYNKAKTDPQFGKELMDLYKNYSGRPTPLSFAANLTKQLGGAKIYLKNEGLNITGAHKINHCLGQALLARRMGKTRLIAETGAGQHGLATATVAAKFNMDCTVFMGEVDYFRQRPNVFWMEQLGAEVIPVKYGAKRLKDAVMAAIQDWISSYKDSYYLLGSALGPHPYPSIVRDLQNIVGVEVEKQLQQAEESLPDYLIACVGGGSNAIGLFNNFLENENVKMIGVEAGGKDVNKTGQHAARFQGKSKVGVVEGYKSFFLQDEDGQVQPTHSISAGLDYAGVGPQHALLFERGRVEYKSVSDEEVLDAFKLLAKTEGILAALESSHAVAQCIKLAPKLDKDKIIVVNISGRGDKDIFIVAKEFGDEKWKEYLRSQC